MDLISEAVSLRPSDEVERVCSVQRTGLLDTPLDPRFDRLTRLTARLFDAPLAMVSLMDSDRLWLMAAVGFAQGLSAPRDDTFCAYTVLDPTQPLIVPDTRQDPRFASNPFVTGPESICFYAGVPVLDAEKRVLGSLCVFDTKPRHLSSSEVETLCDLAFQASVILQMEQAAAAQRESEEHHRWAVALSPQSQWVADANGNLLEIRAEFLDQLGMTLDEVHDEGWIRSVFPDDQARVRDTFVHSLRTGERMDYEFRFCMVDGSRRWVRSRAAPRRDEAGQIVRWYGAVEDIDDRKTIELAVEEGRRRLEGVLESTTDFVAFFDRDWRATYLNPHFRCIEAYAELLGKVLWEAMPDLIGSSVEKSLRQAQDSGSPVNLEWYSSRLGGWMDVHAYPTPQGISLFIRDVTEQHQLSQQLLHQVEHDPLTDLPNRTLLHSELRARLGGNPQGVGGQALLRLRLDGFRSATDTFGPAMGEALIQRAAERLQHFVQAGCFVAALDGPEFAVLPVSTIQRPTLDALANDLLDTLERPYSENGSTIRLKLSVGIARTPDDAQDADQLLQAAEIAMSQARSGDGQGYSHFTASMRQGLENRHQLVRDLREAAERCEISLAYQPLVDFPLGQIGGFEALMRWRHPTRGAVSPAEFIPVAEQSGVIMELGAIALRQACQDAMTWRSPVRVAVNLSPVQFRDPKLVALVAHILEETKLPASRLKLEITETVLLEDSETNLAVLHQLKDLGVLIVLDDFGTGYSSLGYLQRFPFHKLKIDQSFVRPLIERPESQAIVRSILDLARALGIDTTAEGVETQEQLQWLVREGCGQIQGYLLGRPMPAGDVNRFLQDFACPRGH
ncbi:EAL domain-containing protein [Roseomonas sp. 573]|uniref:EAL domain-containing protein n=1 Tax=Roseomonas haemaphysalidis TaxID=2768162 RepID=A0ABS3KYS7_9PROT|nr:EAL domain-containing protein [Roseomonas haemaphysalidis]